MLPKRGEVEMEERESERKNGVRQNLERWACTKRRELGDKGDGAREQELGRFRQGRERRRASERNVNKAEKIRGGGTD